MCLGLNEGLSILVWILGDMDSVSLNLVYHLFEVNLPSKIRCCGLVSICQLRNVIFRVYIDTWKSFKDYYFLVFPLSPLSLNDFWNVSSPSSAPQSILNGGGDFGPHITFLWNLEIIKFCMDLLSMRKRLWRTLLSFSNLETYCHDITNAKSVDERRKLFGIVHSLLLLVIFTLAYYLTS